MKDLKSESMELDAKLKYKICIALEALIEGQKKNTTIIRCMAREINTYNLRYNLIDIYQKYKEPPKIKTKNNQSKF